MLISQQRQAFFASSKFMTTQLKENNYLKIQLLSYDRHNELTESFYFTELSTLQVTTLFPKNMKVISSNVFAYTNNDKYLDKDTISSFKTIEDFNTFFSNNPNYHIHDCNIEVEHGINLCSHDDGEVLIEFPINNYYLTLIIDKIFEKYNLDKKLIDLLKTNRGHYIAIDKQNNIMGDFKNFEDYLENRPTSAGMSDSSE